MEKDKSSRRFNEACDVLFKEERKAQKVREVVSWSLMAVGVVVVLFVIAAKALFDWPSFDGLLAVILSGSTVAACGLFVRLFH